MAQRDYKPKSGSPGKSKSRGGTLIGIVIGLVLGLIIAVGVAFYLNRGPKPFADKTGREKPPSVGKMDKGASNDPNSPLYGKDARTPDPKKEGKDDLTFYKILPGEEKASAGTDKGSEAKKDTAKDAGKDNAKDAAKEAAKDAAKAADALKGGEGKEQYYLQAGAFGSAGDADNQKAKLALLGFEAKVEASEIEGKGTMHRVRIGPYGRLDDINRVRATLAQNGVDASLIKMKEGQK